MSQGHMSHGEFFARLSELLSARQGKDHGSVYFTQKRLSHNTSASSTTSANKANGDHLSDLNPDSPLPIVVRATNGKGKRSKSKKVKLSTVVQPEDIEGFFVKYADVCKAGMQGLKKRDRKARKTNKSKKKKGGAEIEIKA